MKGYLFQFNWDLYVILAKDEQHTWNLIDEQSSQAYLINSTPEKLARHVTKERERWRLIKEIKPGIVRVWEDRTGDD